MSKALFELQNNIKNLRQQLNDRIHLAFLNHQSYLCVKSTSSQPFKQINPNIQPKSESNTTNNLKSSIQKGKIQHQSQTFNINQLNTTIQTKLKNISQIFQKRSQNQSNYLIIRQIQSEQECVRRDRLTEYEQKIYDQRRLISDKQVFTQSLLRPKKQRPQNMTSEQFQQVRAIEKAQEQKGKVTALELEVKSLQSFRRKISESKLKNSKGIQNVILLKKEILIQTKVKNEDLQRTKANSLETVNTSNMNNICEKHEKPFEESEFNGQIPVINESESKGSEGQKNNQRGQCQIEQTHKVRESGGCHWLDIQKLLRGQENKSSQEEMGQKLKRIGVLLARIKEKKGENAVKGKQCRQLEAQNMHMKVHLKKTRMLYLQARSVHTNLLTRPLQTND